MKVTSELPTYASHKNTLPVLKMSSKRTWIAIIVALLLVQLGGISFYILHGQKYLVHNMINELESKSETALRVFRQKQANSSALTAVEHQPPSTSLRHDVTSFQTEDSIDDASRLDGSRVDPGSQLRIDDVLKRVATRQLSKPMPLINRDGKSWDKLTSTFCHSFLIDTFSSHVSTCSSKGSTSSDSIECYGNNDDPAHMATCTLRNLAVQPKLLYESIEGKFDKEGTIFLISDRNTSCPNPTVQSFSKKVERDDFQLKLLNKIVTSEPKPSSVCDAWINKTTFFFINEKYHIYFRFIEYYSVHKALWDHQVDEGDYVVLRISTNERMLFPEFDDALFPGAINLKDLPQNATVCFKKAVTVPRCFSSIPFRTKMNGLIRNKCFQCKGRGLTGTPFYTFRERTIRACNLTDDQPKEAGGTLVVISRKPYVRYPSDEFKRFERVLSNEDNLVSELKKTFPSSELSVIHLEDLPICEQIRYAHSADVILGVHGAGLVHFWWLRENALAYEMEPGFEVGNPTFKMLTTLTGRQYRSVRISGQMKKVTVDVAKVAKEILNSNVVGNA